MPVVAFVCPLSDDVIPFEKAPAYFEKTGIVPAEVVNLLIQEANAERTKYDPKYCLSPSRMSPATTCRRQVLIQAFLPYNLNPLVMWDANEGTIWHRAFASLGTQLPEWSVNEVKVPDEVMTKVPTGTKLCSDGFYRTEVLPGLWMRGTVDRHSLFTKIVDHKTTKFPFAVPPNYVPKRQYIEERVEEWSYQFSFYALIIETVRPDLTVEDPMFAWQMYRGSRNRAFTFQKLPVRKQSKKELESSTREWLQPMLEWTDRCSKVENTEDKLAELEEIIREVPMDGSLKDMFNGQKCTKYCAQRETCYALEGGSELEF